jgi:hypothetical protein
MPSGDCIRAKYGWCQSRACGWRRHCGKALRNEGNARSREDDKLLEALQTLEKELIELGDTMLQIAV